MSENESLAESVFNMVQAVRTGEIDPLELRLTQAYKDLQELAAKIDSRIDIDEMLNEILSAKVNRVQELARILAAPEIYVNRLKGLSMRNLAKMAKMSKMEDGSLNLLIPKMKIKSRIFTNH